MRNMMKLVIGALMVACATPAMAGELMFGSGGTKSGNGLLFSNGEVTMRASAWSFDGDDVDSAQLGQWSDGLGVINGRNDNSHTIDNVGNIDFVLMQFDHIISLNKAEFNTGWHGMFDTDATIGFANLAISSALTLSDFTFYHSNAGWLLPSFDDTRNINPDGHSGNVWLIGASAKSLNLFDDGFKLGGVSYDVVTPAVPEPSTWLMLILGFGLVGGMLRFVRREGQLSLA